ncbi:hypothetical protein GBA52_012702 [Prunus armeniaca]|nr:hypothetical protein GBA52_012702 [Prunus armeniaca]
MNSKSIIERRDGEGERERDWKNERTTGARAESGQEEAWSASSGKWLLGIFIINEFFKIILVLFLWF